MCVCVRSVNSIMSNSATLGNVAGKVPLSMGFSKNLEWVARLSSRGSSQPRVQTHTYVSCIGRQLLYHSCHLGNPFVCLKVKVSLPHCRRILDLAKPFVCVSCDRYMCLCLSNELTEINDKFQEYCRPVSFSTWKMPSANRNYFISSFLFCLSFISFLLLFFCLIALARTSSTVLKEGRKWTNVLITVIERRIFSL